MLHQHLFFGIVSFQLLFIAIQWAIFKRQEYGLYILYILSISTYFLLKYLAGNDDYILIDGFSFNKLTPDKSLSFLAFGIYIKFGRKFLGTKQSTPQLNKSLIILENSIIIYTIINFLFVLFTHDFTIESYAFAGAFGIAFITSIILLFKLYQNNLYSKYLIIGSSMVALGACLALYLGLSNPHLGIGKNGTTIYLQAGVIADFVFLNIGLVVKTKLLQMRELEKQKAIELERLRISSELHDDLGGGLSTIRLLSEMMKEKPGNENVDKQLNTISDSSKELVQKMNEIVWALNTQNDTLANLLAYTRHYIAETLNKVNIACKIFVPDEVCNINFTGDKRRIVFLLVKECINNIIKHSCATEAEILFEVSNAVCISIHDNGKGFCTDDIKANSFGISSLKKRAAALQGTIEWKNHNGTTVDIFIPLQNISTKYIFKQH
jgi:signal transduction histidine kinase